MGPPARKRFGPSDPANETRISRRGLRGVSHLSSPTGLRRNGRQGAHEFLGMYQGFIYGLRDQRRPDGAGMKACGLTRPGGDQLSRGRVISRSCRGRSRTAPTGRQPSFRRMPESRQMRISPVLDSGIRRNDERRSKPLPPCEPGIAGNQPTSTPFSGWRGGVFWANMKSHSEVGKPSPMVGSHALRLMRCFIQVRLAIIFVSRFVGEIRS